MTCPLPEGIDLSGARRPAMASQFPGRVLVLIAANKANVKHSERCAAMNTIRRDAADDAHVIFGAACQPPPGRGQDGSAVAQWHGRDRDSRLPAQAGGGRPAGARGVPQRVSGSVTTCSAAMSAALSGPPAPPAPP
ncbi:hypothetical protein AQPW35_31610 [Rubrivivax pictus]|uniref:Uncharacterized protein n=1 Tax=Pseudaquabacterium pictum TaxID=2315236 RepID=A0A480AT88_9BURK|nr:hypothetical protein AQPW35_31610 [Rubrivivax pictus]